MAKICFSLGKTEFWAQCKFCAYRRIVGLTKGPASLHWLFDVLLKQTCEVKKPQVQVYIQQWGANFIAIRKDIEYALICTWVTLFAGVSQWGHVAEMTFSSINFSLDQLILIVVENSLVLFMSAESYIMKIHCSWFVEECHTGIYCHKQKSWKYSLKCNTMEFNNSSWSIF